MVGMEVAVVVGEGEWRPVGMAGEVVRVAADYMRRLSGFLPMAMDRHGSDSGREAKRRKIFVLFGSGRRQAGL
jgi:hypothetical protein